MSNYFGGYYLLRIKKLDQGWLTGREIYTCSACINNSLMDSWSLSWTTKWEDELEKIQREFQIDEETVDNIAIWADKKFESKNIGWANVFADLETVKEYRNKFFSHLADTKIFSIYFFER